MCPRPRSNYARLDGVQADGTQVNQRLHFDEFWQFCEYVPDPQPIIDEHMLQARTRVNALMNEIKALTARLGVGQHQALGSVDDETQAIAVRSGEPVEQYKKALIKAKEETLPDLFGKLKKENATLAGWMHTQLIPLQAQVGSLKELTGAVADRIFNVELYAGLVENVKQVHFASDIDDLITDDDYKTRVADDKKVKTQPKKERWHLERDSRTKDDYIPFTTESVHYDDIMEIITSAMKKHNRIALILQGLLDRSPVFHPHPPWQLWTPEGFEAAVERIFDGSRALSAGDKPDFEKYRAELNARLTEGSLTVGQEIAWEVREAKKENERRARDYRHQDERGYERYRFRPDGDPGPGVVAYVHQYGLATRACTYVWKRRKRGRSGYAIHGTEIAATLTTGEENVLNVDAYKPGDYHIFFDDPRTRQEYLKWAPLLLEAEECHAGNRGLKPQRRLAPIGEREPVVWTEERPMSLKEPAPPKPRPPVGEKYKGKTVRLLRDMETKGGTKFKALEYMKVNYYERKTLSLTAVKGKDRSIRGVSVHDVKIVDDPTP